MVYSLALLILLPITGLAQKHINKEVVYQLAYSDTLTSIGVSNLTEVRLRDNTRCDIVTDTFAIEVDFADKWAEAIGQSLHYSIMLDKKPAILLILEDPKNSRYLDRLMVTATKYGVKVWVVDSNFNIKFVVNKVK